MNPQDFSFCGVDCEACDLYRATITGDKEAFERAYESWTKTAQQHWGMETLDPAILHCRGCRDEGEDRFYGRKVCPIRRCVQERGLSSCGLCSEWRACETLMGLLADCPQARSTLERIAGQADQS